MINIPLEDRNFWDRDQNISPGNDYSFVKKAVISPKWINWQHATTHKKKKKIAFKELLAWGTEKQK